MIAPTYRVSESDTSFLRPLTSRQRRGLAWFCLLLIGVGAAGRIVYRANVSDPLPAAGDRFELLQDQIDPNTADMPALAALPALGEKRARDIVEFREKSRASRPGETTFQKPEDLMQVRGIGVAIVEQVRPYLRFAEATSAPAQ